MPFDPYRPGYHFSPRANRINDPNGLLLDGQYYHLYYQYNPLDSQWGNMSWGHAISTDLLTWVELPVAIERTATNAVFSGSTVIDVNDMAGFGRGPNDEPAIVAIYTDFLEEQPGVPYDQTQAIAYSLDGGLTFTRYAGNPVIDLPSNAFRDPKVVWDEDAGHWLMSVVLAVDRKVQFYASPNLIDWTLLSEFGPANAVGGVWEVPDLILDLAVDGDPSRTKDLLVVNINPGSIAGGSGAQYFLGDWDGTTFTADTIREAIPADGTVFEDFEDGSYNGWIVTGSAFGAGPPQGTLPGQNVVTFYRGHYTVNSFLAEDGVSSGGWTGTDGLAGVLPTAGSAPEQSSVTGFGGEGLLNSFNVPAGTFDTTVGTVVSPHFVITADFISFLIGGGGHTDPAIFTGMRLVIDGVVVRSAVGSFSETLLPTSWDVSDLIGQTARIEVVDANSGEWGHVLVDDIELNDISVLDLPPTSATVFADFEGGVLPAGWVASGDFVGITPIDGAAPDQQAVTGYQGDGLFNSFNYPSGFDAPIGKITSSSFVISAAWINFMVGGGAHTGEFQTAVNLIVDGAIVRQATGAESENLSWVAWDVADLVGRTATIEVVDNNSGGWGHILVDQIEFADAPAVRSQAGPTAVNLVVDGQRVATASGKFGEGLDWASWDVSACLGRNAQIEIVDANAGGWGHINADHFTFGDEAALPSELLADWLDFGSDNCAIVSYNNLPDGRVVWLGWMSNWTYARRHADRRLAGRDDLATRGQAGRGRRPGHGRPAACGRT